MNPENNPFFNSQEETNENKAENKEKKEYVNLSFILASDLIKQIKSGEKLKLTDYQKCCEYAVIHNKITNQYETWEIVGDGFSDFLDELPEYYEKIGDPNMKIFFCVTQYDIPLWRLQTETEQFERRNSGVLTPNGVQYQTEMLEKNDKTQKLRSGIKIKYFDTKPLSFEQVQEKLEQVNKKSDEYGEIQNYWEFPESLKH